jgi:uncharacterized protein (TIGR00725 family)
VVAYIGVVGPGDGATADDLADAEYLGARIAEQGWHLVCGGLGGVMAAASRGARAAGGLTIGLLPGSDRSAGNEHLSVALPTGLGELRNGLLVRASDALAAVGGSWGTLAEIALALRTGTPVVGLRCWAVTAGGEPAPPGPTGAALVQVTDRDALLPALRAALTARPPA